MTLNPITYIREHLSAKIALRLIALAIPILSAAAWFVAQDSRAAAAEMILDQGRVAALSGAAAFTAVLETGIDAGQLTLSDVLDPGYEEIRFPGILVEHRRYHTRLGDYTDAHGIQGIEDGILASLPESLVYASAIDRRGYVPTPHRKYAQAPTGDFRHDRAVSRGKRMYDDDEQIAAAGFRGNAGATTLVQDYHRDGDLIWDVAAPITVKGQHFGAFRVGVVRTQVDLRTRALALALARVLAIAALILGLAILIWTRRALLPLGEMAIAATRISSAHDPSDLRAPIRSPSRDEVGRIARALDRMRQSMLKVWDKV